jgi:hypothetical protein
MLFIVHQLVLVLFSEDAQSVGVDDRSTSIDNHSPDLTASVEDGELEESTGRRVERLDLGRGNSRKKRRRTWEDRDRPGRLAAALGA